LAQLVLAAQAEPLGWRRIRIVRFAAELDLGSPGPRPGARAAAQPAHNLAIDLGFARLPTGGAHAVRGGARPGCRRPTPNPALELAHARPGPGARAVAA